MPKMSKALNTDNLIVGYGAGNRKKVVLSNITFEAMPGNIITLIGPNGSGKSTILKTITGQLSKISGRIAILGSEIEELREKDMAKKMSMVMTTIPKTELMTAWEMVATGRYPYTGMLGILSEHDKDMVNEALEMVNASIVAEQQFDSLSDGQRQRVMLARAICQEPEILILDEPTSFLDIRYKIDILRNIKELAVSKNIAVIMSLHELEFAKAVSDYIIAVNDGNVVKQGVPSEIFKDDIIQKLYGIENDEFDTETGYVKFNRVFENKNVSASNVVTEKDSKNNSDELENNLKVSNKAKVIMVQGTMSNAGKSLIVAGLCRVFMKDGYKVAPFKSQNMALNSYITRDGFEMGRAQVMQAECAGIEPNVNMNPILLKPTSDQGSQVIVNGKPIGNMKARDYFAFKTKLKPDIIKAYNTLCENVDIVVVEGAGSPAEINLKENDIVNMGLANMLDAPVLLVGDIDRGGVFAQLLGTIELLEKEERSRVKGLIINKFRGDKSLLDSGITMLEDKGNIKVSGVIPYMNISVEDEDSLSTRFDKKVKKDFDIAIIKYPHISNFTDFDIFEQFDISVRYVTKASEIENADIVILPGSKNTIDDLKWIYDNNFDAALNRVKDKGTIIFGICGGYQMLGRTISDPYEVESGGNIDGLGLLPIKTVLKDTKNTKQFKGEFCKIDGLFNDISKLSIDGYEIHMGESAIVNDQEIKEFTPGNTGYYKENVYGSYIHGLFDNGKVAEIVVLATAKKNGKVISAKETYDYKTFKEKQYDILEKTIREYMDMDYIYSLLDINR